MIAIRREDLSPVRVFDPAADARIEFHSHYGFVSASVREGRDRIRRRGGAHVADQGAEFEFEIDAKPEFKVVALRGCEAIREGDGFRLKSSRGEFLIGPLKPVAYPAFEKEAEDRTWLRHTALGIGVAVLLLLIASIPGQETKLSEAEKEVIAPVVLNARPPTPAKPEATQAPDPQAKTKKALSQQLGFLSLLGRKDFKKATGGLPTPSEKATAGAGAGGEQGSGGELLAGMGQGLHKTTVGNSGVAGLGGVGTKGAGGGLGGYGDTAFGGAGGSALSAIPLAREAQIDEGLDRSQIQATIMRYLSQVRACYEEGLKRNQSMIGQITMGFEINSGGALNFARVQRSSLGDRPVEDCVQTKMLTWKFPQPRGGVTVKVSYPFMLRPVRS